MSGVADDLDVIAPGPLGAVILGETMVHVRALRVGQLPAFARALKPIADDIGRIMDGDVSASSIIDLVAEHTEHIIEAASAATGASPDLIREATIEQLLELVAEILRANRDFLRGRLLSAIKLAATPNRGDGPTPSAP